VVYSTASLQYRTSCSGRVHSVKRRSDLQIETTPVHTQLSIRNKAKENQQIKKSIRLFQTTIAPFVGIGHSPPSAFPTSEEEKVLQRIPINADLAHISFHPRYCWKRISKKT
jgi:hypothetical protein